MARRLFPRIATINATTLLCPVASTSATGVCRLMLPRTIHAPTAAVPCKRNSYDATIHQHGTRRGSMKGANTPSTTSLSWISLLPSSVLDRSQNQHPSSTPTLLLHNPTNTSRSTTLPARVSLKAPCIAQQQSCPTASMPCNRSLAVASSSQCGAVTSTLHSHDSSATLTFVIVRFDKSRDS